MLASRTVISPHLPASLDSRESHFTRPVLTSTSRAMSSFTPVAVPTSAPPLGRAQAFDSEDESVKYDQSIENHPRLLKCEWVGCKVMMGSYALLNKHTQKVHCDTQDFGMSGTQTQKRCPCRYGKCSNRLFASPQTMAEHITNHHLQPVRLMCPIKGCRRPQQSNSLLRRHLHGFHELNSSLLPRSKDGSPAPSAASSSTQAPNHPQVPKHEGTNLIPVYSIMNSWVHKYSPSNPRTQKTRSAKPMNEPIQLEPFFQEMWDDDEPLPENERLELGQPSHLPEPSSQELDADMMTALLNFGQMQFGLQVPDDLAADIASRAHQNRSKGKEKETGPIRLGVKVSIRLKGYEPDPFIPTRKLFKVPASDEVRWSSFTVLKPNKQSDGANDAVPIIPELQRSLSASRTTSEVSSSLPSPQSPPRPITIGFEALKAFSLVQKKVRERTSDVASIQSEGSGDHKGKRKMPSSESRAGRTRSGKRLRQDDE